MSFRGLRSYFFMSFRGQLRCLAEPTYNPQKLKYVMLRVVSVANAVAVPTCYLITLGSCHPIIRAHMHTLSSNNQILRLRSLCSLRTG